MVVKEDCTYYCGKTALVQDTGRPSRAATQKLIEFTEDEFVEEQFQHFRQPRNPPLKEKPTKTDQNLEIELEMEKITLKRYLQGNSINKFFFEKLCF